MRTNEPSAPGACGPDVDVDSLHLAALERATEGRSSFVSLTQDYARWVRLFNRLDAAVSRHRKAKQEGAFCDDADDALHVAHDRILKSAARSEPEAAGPRCRSEAEAIDQSSRASGEGDG